MLGLSLDVSLLKHHLTNADKGSCPNTPLQVELCHIDKGNFSLSHFMGPSNSSSIIQITSVLSTLFATETILNKQISHPRHLLFCLAVIIKLLTFLLS